MGIVNMEKQPSGHLNSHVFWFGRSVTEPVVSDDRS